MRTRTLVLVLVLMGLRGTMRAQHLQWQGLSLRSEPKHAFVAGPGLCWRLQTEGCGLQLAMLRLALLSDCWRQMG